MMCHYLNFQFQGQRVKRAYLFYNVPRATVRITTKVEMTKKYIHILIKTYTSSQQRTPTVANIFQSQGMVTIRNTRRSCHCAVLSYENRRKKIGPDSKTPAPHVTSRFRCDVRLELRQVSNKMQKI